MLKSAKSYFSHSYNSMLLSFYIGKVAVYLSAKTIVKNIVQNWYIIDKFLHDIKLNLTSANWYFEFLAQHMNFIIYSILLIFNNL